MPSEDIASQVLARLTRPRRSPVEPHQAAWLVTGEQRELAHAGAKIAVRSWAMEPGRPRVLLVHGWESQAGAWHVLGPRLVAAGYAPVAHDAPGHGASGGAGTDVRAMGQALAAVARALGPVDAVLAHSLGSPATLYAFASGLRVRASVHLAGPSSLLRAFERAAGLACLDAAGARTLRERFMLATGYAPAEMELDRLADGLRHPALLLHDPEDDEVPYAESAALAAAWPLARLAPVVAAGHRRLPESEAVAQRIVDFLGAARD